MTFIEKTVDYFRSAKAEMFKVSWPSRRDTFRYSALIIGISVVVAAFFASLDYGFTSLFDATVTRFAQSQPAAQTQAPVTPVPINSVDVQTQPTEVQTQPAAPTPTQNINLQNAKPIETPNKK